MKALQHLIIDNLRGNTDHVLALFEEFPNLESLTINGSYLDVCHPSTRVLANLRYLKINCLRMAPTTFEILIGECPQLESFV